MKKISQSLFFILLLVALCKSNVNAQIQFANIDTGGGESIGIVPRISWSLPVYSNFSKLGEQTGILSKFGFRNGGFIYNQGENRFKHRNISFGGELNFGFLAKKMLIYAGYGLEYNFHYKHKVFVNKERSKKEIIHNEWGSARVNPIGHYATVGILLPNGIFLYGNYYFNQFFNQSFEENINGVVSKPYENLSVNRFDIGISFSRKFSKLKLGKGQKLIFTD